MADRIKGITVVIDGDTSELQSALSDVNRASKNLQGELKDVQRLLKFDPNNVELLAQRQRLLNEQIENSSQKLNQLKEAEAQVQEQFRRGEIGADQYRAFQRELTATEQSIRQAQNQLADMADEQENVGKSTRELTRLFEATNSSLEDFSEQLGTRLVRAIQNGTATTRDLNRAFDIVGRNALGASVDINEVRQSIRRLESGEESIRGVRRQLQGLSQDAQEARDSAKDLGGELSGAIAGAAAGVGIQGIIEKAMDTTNLDTTIDISFNVPEESKQAVKDAVSAVEVYGVETEVALEGVRKQFALNIDKTNEQNEAIVQSAGAISRAFTDIDFNELIQESNEMAKNMGMSQEEALGMTNALLKMGFPPDQLDIITEYGTQLSRAGYSAEEIQGIMAAGVETGTWNIDVLLDGLKEGRIILAEFGGGVDKATKELLKGTDISAKQLESWGQSVAKGGEEGKKAMEDVALAVANIDDKTKQNEVGVKVFGTLWEEQGTKITDTLINAEKWTGDLKNNQDLLNQSVAQLEADPQVRMNEALSNMSTALQPLMIAVAEFVGKIADWMAKNPELASTITAVVTVLGILIGIAMALAPIITALIGVMGFFGLTVGAIATPVLIIIGVIAALIAIGVLLWKNWDTISAKASELGKKIMKSFTEWKEGVKERMNQTWEDIKRIWGKVTGFFEGIDLKSIGRNIIQGLIDGIADMKDKVWKKAKEIADSVGKTIKGALRIGSPSKLTMELGEFTGEGLVEGLANSMGQIRNMSNKMAKAAVPNVEIPKAQMASAMPSSGNSLTVNLHSPKALDVREASLAFNRTLNKMSLMW